MKKILILGNAANGLYNFRNEILLRLLQEYEVHLSLPDGNEVPQLAEEGCIVHHTDIDRRGMNPLRDFNLFLEYRKILEEIHPDVVLTYTIKPNVYGGLCCRFLKIPYITNITGLGSVFERGGMVRNLVVRMYKSALKNSRCVFFQNDSNQKIFEQYGICGKKFKLIPGSGVNLERHYQEEYPTKDDPIILLYVGRIMKEKGTTELLDAAKQIKKEYEQVVFRLVGSYEDDYHDIIEEMTANHVIEMEGYKKEMHPYYKTASAIIMPSYHEGMSNVILEASATGRPVLASNIPGCREGFEEGKTGFGFPAKDSHALYETIKKFIELPYEQRKQMGNFARIKMEQEFDRQKVVQSYIDEIELIQ